MKVIIKNENKFLNMLYGDNVDYSMNLKDIKIILKEHVKSLEKIYDYLDNYTTKCQENLFDLGDIINLVDYISKNIKKEND